MLKVSYPPLVGVPLFGLATTDLRLLPPLVQHRRQQAPLQQSLPTLLSGWIPCPELERRLPFLKVLWLL